ncbi:MAG: hypothetical protein VYD77_04420 [Actinomycetota bacterium]|nr:hypothetical protein [Actinomycetota bacterium]
MAIRYRTFKFSANDFDEVTTLLRDHHHVNEQNFWVHLEPMVEEGEVHQSSIFWRMFSSRGPIIPKFTWVPSYEKKGQVVPAQIGITHPVGTKAIERLKDFEIEIPQGWILHQDHPKRGMVISLPEGCSQDQVVSFAVRTLEILSPFDFDGNYVASVTT